MTARASDAARGQGGPRSRWLWVPVGVVILALLAISLTAPPAPGQTGTVANTISFLMFIGSFAGVGALIVAKRPTHPIGWLLLGSALCYAFGGTGVSIRVPAGAAGTVTPAMVLVWAGSWSWGVGVGLPVLVLLLFPGGQLASRRWRPVLWITVAAIVAFVLGMGFGAPTVGDSDLPNPFAVGGPVGELLRGLLGDPGGPPLGAFPVILLTALLAALSIGVRFRRSRGTEREQIKWLSLAALVVMVGFLVPIVVDLGTDASNALLTSTLATIPVAIGIAILRYRLWDIDRIISRTIGWAIVTGAIVATFAIAVFGLDTMLAGITQGQTLAVAASTLVAFAAFQPIRRRVQATVDRRFDRTRHDNERLLAAFSDRLRDQVDLATIRVDLIATIDSAVRPSSVSGWLRERSRGES